MTPCAKCTGKDHNKLHCELLTEAQQRETMQALPRPLLHKILDGPATLCPSWLLSLRAKHQGEKAVFEATHNNKKRLLGHQVDDSAIANEGIQVNESNDGLDADGITAPVNDTNNGLDQTVDEPDLMCVGVVENDFTSSSVTATPGSQEGQVLVGTLEGLDQE
ncbi:unnamed protein product [Ambrosiozyma monospora]|uniref:Unnamed protein product n=1 Tax=Ambrosiozyma monospora TaxID=43982 RepID=A0A9W6Z9F1_AMBMO|nr:unnamed protein product [Ambrosiozyma monospora]